MKEKEYSVSEAVRLIGVESHVLRYWEEELQIEIRRTSQGHRIYSRENVETFCRVKKLKDKGLQLKAIRLLLAEPEADCDAATKNSLRKLDQLCRGEADQENRDETEPVLEESRHGEVNQKNRDETESVLEESRLGEADQKNRDETESVLEESRHGGANQKNRDEAESVLEESCRGEGDQENRDEAESVLKESRLGEADQENRDETESVLEESRLGEGDQGNGCKSDSGETYQEEPLPGYEIIISGEKKDYLEEFEEILRKLIGEVIAEENEKLEKAVAAGVREELEDFYLQFYQMVEEAAAAGTEPPKKSRIRRLLQRIFLR